MDQKFKKLLPKDDNKHTGDGIDLEFKGRCHCDSEMDYAYDALDLESESDLESDYDSNDTWRKPFNFWEDDYEDLSDSDRFYWKDTDSEYSNDEDVSEEEETIFNPDTLHSISAKSICHSIRRAHDLFTLPLPWALKYHLLDIFANKTNIIRERGLRMKYTSIFVHKFGYITGTAQYRGPSFDFKRKKPLPKCLNVRALFTQQVRVKFLIEYWNLKVQKGEDSQETFCISQICHKCHEDISKYSEKCTSVSLITDTYKVSDENCPRFDYFLYHVVRGDSYICRFCRKTILIIPLQLTFRTIGLIDQERDFRDLGIPFNWRQ